MSRGLNDVTHILSFDTLELARQWTLLDHRFYKEIAVNDLSGYDLVKCSIVSPFLLQKIFFHFQFFLIH